MNTDQGIGNPFCSVVHHTASFPTTQNVLSLTLSDTKINNLEKVILCIRRTTDCGDSALYDKFVFRNGSHIECA